MFRNKPTVVITKISPRWNYFQYFLLAFYELQKAGEINFKIKTDCVFKLSTLLPNIQIFREILRRLKLKFNKDSYNLNGYVKFNGKKKTFCIDSADAPYLFDSESLERVNVYFKMQCPNQIDPQGFKLTDLVIIPYSDHKHQNEAVSKLTAIGPRKPLLNLQKNIAKIKPLMVGFRRLAEMNSYSCLKAGYENYRKGAVKEADKKLVCYFGNALGPKPSENVKEPDLDWESDLMGFYKQLNHPNEKRAKIAQQMRKKGEAFDARIISENFADGKSQKHPELIIPIEQFCAFISHFEYNMNVSGYRMSVPNRFIESFIVGTAIFTDKLALKWYLPFDEEVKETVKMGYLPIEQVNWQQFDKDFSSLPKIDKKQIFAKFDEKWAPLKVAEYLLKEVLEA